jgi:predicted nucleic acid-binding Zn ribbon protein
MALCQATCKHGGACHFKAKQGYSVCGKHMAQDKEVVVVLCGEVKTNGQVCGKTAEVGGQMCKYHAQVAKNREERRQGRIVWHDALEELWTHANPAGGLQRIFEAFTNETITLETYTALVEVYDEEIAFWNELHVVPKKVEELKGELHRLSLDKQNVHTGPVAKQTTDALDKLLEIPVPEGQKTLEEIKDVIDAKCVLRDMRKWYNTAFCRKEDDYLYRRALDGLWAHIKGNSELEKRLWEEAFDSKGMCCEGHLSRLSNVLVGFDDSFEIKIPIGEILQQRMSAIASEDIDVYEKVGKAWFLMEELAIPLAEREAWIDAL